MRTSPALAAAALALLLVAGCGSDSSGPARASSSAATSPNRPEATSGPNGSSGSASPDQSAATSPVPVARTPELDAIGVIGHSGATGADSEGDGLDVVANSWVTGTNPKLGSIYERLSATHPALRGHNDNEAVSGSSVVSLMHQAEALLTYDPVPDIVFIVSVDNDIQCDGSDPDNYDAFTASMTDVVGYLQASDPGVKIFFNDQPTSVRAYDATVLTMPDGPAHLDVPGPCNVMKDGAVDPAGEAYLQHQVDTYYGLLSDVCGHVEDCATDRAALQDMPLAPQDLAEDLDHLSVSGLAKEAAIVWDQLPAAWKR